MPNFWPSYRNKIVKVNGSQVKIGDDTFMRGDNLDCGAELGFIPVEDIARAMEHYTQLTHGQYNPQLAALICAATNNPLALDSYFPIVRMLNDQEINSFHQLIRDLAEHSNLEVQLWGENRVTVTEQMQSDILYLIAGHLAEIFFYRRDILNGFLSQPRHIWLYVTQRAFADAGGQAGGNYDPATESIQLVISRLVEGFYGSTAGVAPFLHEFGHMLDAFDAGTGQMEHGDGLLPGLNPKDGAIYTPKARELFIRGKRIELERYLIHYNDKTQTKDPLPIGHPYVFQNDAEFAAGYLEMFFRNPHYFAGQNSDLFQSYVELFRYDPRGAWEQDFQFYINQNRDFYFSDERPWKTGLTIPEL